MKRIALAAILLLAAPPLAAEEPAVFEPGAESFADAPSCKAHLVRLAGEARGSGYDAVEGPYDVAPADVRIHMVRAEREGHRIAEHRCVDAAYSSRSWRHSMGPAEPEFTIESVARDAEWLKKDAPEQQ